MKRKRFSLLMAAFVFWIVSITPLEAKDERIGNLVIEQAWARASPGRAANGAAYLSIHNAGKTADRLLSVTTTAADKAAIHTHLHEAGVMKMRPAGPVALPPGETVQFKPGGLHIMLFALKAPLKQGDRLRLDVVFEKAGRLEVVVDILKVGAAGP